MILKKIMIFILSFSIVGTCFASTPTKENSAANLGLKLKTLQVEKTVMAFLKTQQNHLTSSGNIYDHVFGVDYMKLSNRQKQEKIKTYLMEQNKSTQGIVKLQQELASISHKAKSLKPSGDINILKKQVTDGYQIEALKIYEKIAIGLEGNAELYAFGNQLQIMKNILIDREATLKQIIKQPTLAPTLINKMIKREFRMDLLIQKEREKLSQNGSYMMHIKYLFDRDQHDPIYVFVSTAVVAESSSPDVYLSKLISQLNECKSNCAIVNQTKNENAPSYIIIDSTGKTIIQALFNPKFKTVSLKYSDGRVIINGY